MRIKYLIFQDFAELESTDELNVLIGKMKSSNAGKIVVVTMTFFANAITREKVLSKFTH